MPHLGVSPGPAHPEVAEQTAIFQGEGVVYQQLASRLYRYKDVSPASVLFTRRQATFWLIRVQCMHCMQRQLAIATHVSALQPVSLARYSIRACCT